MFLMSNMPPALCIPECLNAVQTNSQQLVRILSSSCWCPHLKQVQSISVNFTAPNGRNELSLLYDFSIHCNGRLLMSGRASVMIKPPVTPGTVPVNP